jgi:hypothetical protein
MMNSFLGRLFGGELDLSSDDDTSQDEDTQPEPNALLKKRKGKSTASHAPAQKRPKKTVVSKSVVESPEEEISDAQILDESTKPKKSKSKKNKQLMDEAIEVQEQTTHEPPPQRSYLDRQPASRASNDLNTSITKTSSSAGRSQIIIQPQLEVEQDDFISSAFPQHDIEENIQSARHSNPEAQDEEMEDIHGQWPRTQAHSLTSRQKSEAEQLQCPP